MVTTCLDLLCVLHVWIMYSRGWEGVYIHICFVTYAIRLCECLHEHIWLRTSDGDYAGFVRWDCPVYAKRIYAMHFIVACLGVCLCDFAYVPGVWLCGFAKSYWILLSWCLSVWLHLVFVCVTSPALCGLLVRVRIFLCGFAYPTTLRGEVNFPENHACDESVIGCHTHCRSLH